MYRRSKFLKFPSSLANLFYKTLASGTKSCHSRCRSSRALCGFIPSDKNNANHWCMYLVCFAAGLIFIPEAAASQSSLSLAHTHSQKMLQAKFTRLHDYMHKITGVHGYLGGVSFVLHNGRIVDWKAYGYRDLARTKPMRKNSIFRIYSMTKTVASTAVMMLVEEGKVGLTDPLSKYLPGFSKPEVLVGGSITAPKLQPAKAPVTILELLTHTAGYPSSDVHGDKQALHLLELANPEGADSLADFAQRMRRVPLAAEPGTRFGYDAASMELLARVVEVVSGESFENFLQQRIFSPLQMHDTGFSVPPAQRGRVVALPTMSKNGKLVLADTTSARNPGEPLRAYASAAGGLYSTAGDYAKFAQMLLNGGTLDGYRLLERKTVEQMIRNNLTMLHPPVTPFNKNYGFGIGGYVVLKVASHDDPGAPGRYGWSGAASTYYTIDPKEHLVAILMLQYLPRMDADKSKNLPRASHQFYRLVYKSLR